jgi:hypothetical protein
MLATALLQPAAHAASASSEADALLSTPTSRHAAQILSRLTWQPLVDDRLVQSIRHGKPFAHTMNTSGINDAHMADLSRLGALRTGLLGQLAFLKDKGVLSGKHEVAGNRLLMPREDLETLGVALQVKSPSHQTGR